MTEKTKARKPRRKLSDIDFSGEGAHLALVNKQQGGPANGADYALVIKARQFSPEFIEKMQQVKVTMELPDFLQKFFYLMREDAKVLAYMMGYVEPAETQAEENMEAEEEYQDWIKSKMEAFEIVKSLHESDSLAEILSEISEDDYLALMNDQQTIEKAFKKIEKASKESKANAEDDTSQIGTEVEKEDEVQTSVVNKANKENEMTTELKTVEQEVTVEMVEKSAFEAVQKALDEQKQALQKAMETIAQFEAEKKDAIVKSKTAQLKEVVDAKHLDVVAKAALALESDEDFTSFVSAMKEIKENVEKSALFQEQGASGDTEEIVKESGVAKILKAKLQK